MLVPNPLIPEFLIALPFSEGQAMDTKQKFTIKYSAVRQESAVILSDSEEQACQLLERQLRSNSQNERDTLETFVICSVEQENCC